MLINSFDFESDFAARCCIGKTVNDQTNNQFIYGDYTPSMDKFSFATEDEIKEFFVEAKKDKTGSSYLNTCVTFCPDIMKQYEKFFKD